MRSMGRVMPMNCDGCDKKGLRVTKKELQDYMSLDENIKSIENEILNIRTQLERITPILSSDPKGGNKDPDKMTMPIHHLIKLEESLNDVVIEKLTRRKEIERIICLLLTEAEQRIVRYRYFEGMKWEEICVRISYEWAQTHRKHSDILIKLNDPCRDCDRRVK